MGSVEGSLRVEKNIQEGFDVILFKICRGLVKGKGCMCDTSTVNNVFCYIWRMLLKGKEHIWYINDHCKKKYLPDCDNLPDPFLST